MYALLLSLALLVASAHASIYVTSPVQSTSCTGGQSCDVQWTDNGQSPLLSAIGDCTVAVYTGQLVLVQTLQSVNVATASSLTFTPDPAAGANGQYYIVFTSTGMDYTGYSATFTLNGMTGTTPTTSGSSTAGPTTTASGSSTSAGSSTPATSPTDTTTASTPSGTSTPVVSTTTPTGSTSTPDSTLSASPTLTTPTLSTSPTSSITTTRTSTSTSTTSTTASATPTSGAGRTGSSISLGGIAALFALTGALAF